MSQLRNALRRAGSCAAAVALIGSTAVVLAPSVVADSPTIRYVATAANGGDDAYVHGVNGDNDCTDMAHPCATIWQAANYDIEWQTGETTVVKVAPGTYRQTEAPSNLWFCQSVEVDGGVDFNHTGAGPTIVQGSAGWPVIQIPAGECPMPDAGPAGQPVVTLNNLDITGDGSDPGVTVGFGASVSISDSTISAGEPGVDVGDATASISDSTLDHNIDAGVRVSGGTASILNSTISGTTDDGSFGSLAGAVVADGGTTNIDTSTIANNAGRGVLATSSAAVTVTDSTIAGTTTGNTDADWPFGGLVAPGKSVAMPLARVRPMIEVAPDSPITVRGSIVGDNTTADCAGVITDGGYNLDSDAKNSCGFALANHDVVGTNPQLGALANNGGPTLTMMPGAGSPAIDAIPNSSGTCDEAHPKDQRGVARPIGAGCDIGAVEAPAAVIPPVVPPVVPPPTCPPLVIDTTTLPDGTVGTPYSVQLQASGGCDNLYSWIVPSEAPDGGFPSVGAQTTAPAGEQTADALRPDDQPVFTPTLHRSPVGAPTSQAAATDIPVNDPPTGNSAPPGLSLGTNGVLSGTPTQAGTFTFTVSVNDPVLATLVLHVAPAAASGTPSPSSSATSPSASATTPSPAGTSHGVGGVSTTAAPPVTATPSASGEPLANTGASVEPQVRLAILLLLGGGALVLAGARRRRRPHRH